MSPNMGSLLVSLHLFKKYS